MDPTAWPQVGARWAGYLGVFLAVGAVVFRFGVLRSWRREHPDDGVVAESLAPRAAQLGVLGAAVALGAAGLRIWLQATTLVEQGEPVDRELLGILLRETAWGRGWLAQFGAAVAMLGGFLAAWVAPRMGWALAAAATLAVVGAAPLTGHAVTDEAGRAGPLLDALHLLGGAAWLGTLLVTLTAGLTPLARLEPALREPLVARLIRAFSPVALAGAMVAILAGMVMSWQYLGHDVGARFAALVGTPYGRALLLKLGLLAGVAGFGAWNWRVITPTLGAPPAADRLHRSARSEMLIGLLLLLATALLVALPMPASAYANDDVALTVCEDLRC